MLHATYKKYILNFGKPAGTSRGVLLSKESYFISLTDDALPGIAGIGECSILKGLSPDDRPDLEAKIKQSCRHISEILQNPIESLSEWPAIRTGFEMAFIDLQNGGKRLLFPSTFTSGEVSIPINGLIWMGKPDDMLRQVDEKLSNGYRVIKLKVGAIDFEEELNLLRYIRSRYTSKEISIRLDANGAFRATEAPEKLKRLSDFDIHSIEQPIRQGQIEAMAGLCSESPVPIALDEELIWITQTSEKIRLLETIRPQYIILKPSLLGGFEASAEWVRLAEPSGTGWWVTSALESNIGLNAIAQWTAMLDNPLPQGLGTGGLFTNNFPSPLQVENGALHFNARNQWDFSAIS
jgi:o-succinylbenzoate synthase